MTTWRDVEKHWNELKPKIRNHWPMISGAELTKIGGKRELLVKRLETDYKLTHAEAERQIDSFLKTLAPAKAGAR